MIDISKLKTELQDKYGILWEEVFELRRYLHQYPECSLVEFKTRDKLIECLEKHGILPEQIQTYLYPGFACSFSGTAPAIGTKQIIGLRCELDALSMEELNTFSYASKNKGVAHMCGHDGHMATLMAVAYILQKHRTTIPCNKTVRLIFQPAEECGEGGRKMVEEGVLDGLDEIYALHNAPISSGIIGLKKGGIMSKGTVTLNISAKEKGISGKVLGVRAVSTLCDIQQLINNLLVFSVAREEYIVCTIGCMSSSEGKGKIRGTIRFEKIEVLELFKEKLISAIKFISKVQECETTIDFVEFTPPVINSEQHAEYLEKAVNEVLGKKAVKPINMKGSEDFSFMTNKIPGALMLVGNIAEGKDAVCLHNPRFDYNEDIIPLSVAIWIKLIEQRFDGIIL